MREDQDLEDKDRIDDEDQDTGTVAMPGVVGLLFDYPTVVVPGSRQVYQPYGEGPRKAQGGRHAAQDSRRLGHQP